MRKAKSRKAPKGTSAPQSVDAYIAAAPQSARARLREMRGAVRSAVPSDATETISYGMPAFRNKRVLVWFGAFSDHCSLFPTAAVIAAFSNELKSYSTSKGTIHFPMDKALPTALIKKIVKARVAQGAAGKAYSRRKG